MATFEPTQEEQDANSYLEWPDSELGKFTKYVATVLSKHHNDSDGLKRVSATSCAMMLVSSCFESNATEMTLTLGGHTHGDIETGDWEIIVRKTS